MRLTATINSYTNSLTDHNGPVFEFSLHDGEDTAMVSLVTTIEQGHAVFLVEYTALAMLPYNAYTNMILAIANAGTPEEYEALVGKTFASED